MFECLKVGEMAMVQVLGLVEHKHIFSTFFFTKSKLQNQLVEHLPTFVCMYSRLFIA
jgi:hypothetical protein